MTGPEAIEANYGFLMNLVSQKISDPDTRMDIFQTCALKAHRYRHKVRPESIRGWFVSIANSVITDHCRYWGVRHLELQPPDEPQDPAHSISPEKVIDDLDEASWLLEGMPADLLDTFVYRFYHDLPMKDTAKRLGTRPGTIGSRVHEAHRHLKRKRILLEP